MKFSQRVPLVLRTVKNWPMLLLDVAGLKASPVYRLRNGLRFHCRGRSPDIGEVIVICSGYEYPERFLLGLPSGGVVLDVGANIGAFSLHLMTLYPSAAIRGYAFEPFRPNVELLDENLAENGVDNFTVVEAAV